MDWVSIFCIGGKYSRRWGIGFGEMDEKGLKIAPDFRKVGQKFIPRVARVDDEHQKWEVSEGRGGVDDPSVLDFSIRPISGRGVLNRYDSRYVYVYRKGTVRFSFGTLFETYFICVLGGGTF